jgi:hypothetical protein
MGVLVNGAIKVEQSFESVKQNARLMGRRTEVVARAKLKPAWIRITNSINTSRPKPIVTKTIIAKAIHPVPNRFQEHADAFVKNAKLRTSAELTMLIDRTIVELEKAKRKLGQGSSRGWAAA